MSYIEWSQALEIGVSEIDEEHKLLISIINRIGKELELQEDKEHIINLVTELLKYADFHFCSEENLMKKHKFPGLELHKLQHEKILSELRERVYTLDYEFINFDNLIQFVIAWYKGHTSSEDLKFAKYLQSIS